jgi:hypothetical protein
MCPARTVPAMRPDPSCVAARYGDRPPSRQADGSDRQPNGYSIATSRPSTKTDSCSPRRSRPIGRRPCPEPCPCHAHCDAQQSTFLRSGRGVILRAPPPGTPAGACLWKPLPEADRTPGGGFYWEEWLGRQHRSPEPHLPGRCGDFRKLAQPARQPECLVARRDRARPSRPIARARSPAGSTRASTPVP